MSEQQRRENHMQYGMVLCSYNVDNCPDGNELFFTAVNQINHGGPSVISDPSQRTILAKLNLKAGKLSIVLSDYAFALSLFEHGISYLGDDKWTSEYEISLDLFDSAAEAACVLNRNAAVGSYTEQLIANAKSFDDSLSCEYSCCRVCDTRCVWYAIHDEILTYNILTDFIFETNQYTCRFGCCCQVSSAIKAYQAVYENLTGYAL
jgi:predicted ATPase